MARRSGRSRKGKRMKKGLALLLSVILGTCVLLSAFAEEGGNDWEAWAKKRFWVRDAVNGCVVVTRNGEELFRYAYGTHGNGGKEAVSCDTLYRCASVTKMVTAVGVMQLVERGLVDLDGDLSDVLPFPVKNPAFPEVKVTLRQVMSHTSSLRGDVGNYRVDWENITLKADPVFRHDAAPGTRYEYANLNGALLGAVIEAVSGQSLNTYMKENVFDPLGITAAYHPSLLPEETDTVNLFSPRGFIYLRTEDVAGEKYSDVPDPAGNLGASVGGLYMSPASLSLLINCLLNGGAYPGGRLLNEGTVRMMEKDPSLFEHSSVTVSSPYGLGLERVDAAAGGTWWGHQGRLSGFTADAYYQRETGLAVAVVCNGYNYRMEGSLVLLALQWLNKAYEMVGGEALPEESFEVLE